MRYKMGLIFICLIICLFSISSVCASEVNETIGASEDQIGAAEAGTDEGSIIIEETNEQPHDDVLSVKDDGTFSDLKKRINEADEGSTITLENDYVYDDGFEDDVITISKPLIINGNGHSINAKSKSGIFYTKCNVNLYNITFMNGCSRYGGAIETSLSVGCNINSCNFLNCWAQKGGAIYIYVNNRVDNTIFSSITSCTFTNCYANCTNSYGGAIYGGGYSIIDSCNFTDCFSIGYSSYGGVISGISDNSIIRSCNFTNCRVDCTAFADGGVISSSANNLTIFDCCFTNCFASADGYTSGGAIYAYGNGLNVTSCSFQDCSASRGANVYGGAIYNEGSDSTINSCSFTRCSAYRGGAIYNKFYAGIANNCKFISITETEADNLTEYIDCYYCESTIITSDVSCIYLNSKVTSTFLDADGKALRNARVTFRIENTDYPSTTNVNGVATANVYLGVGTYDVTAINPVTNQQKTFKLTISKAYSVIALTSAQTREGIAIYASITPSDAKGSVIFAFGGKTYTQSISNGKATLTLSGLTEGNYNISARYNGDSNLYGSSSKTLTFTINPSIIINDISGVYSNTKASAIFLDGNGSPLTYKKVTFEAAGRTFESTTDAEGITVCSIDLDVGSYNITAINPVTKTQKTVKLIISKAMPSITLSVETIDGIPTITASITPSPTTAYLRFKFNGYGISYLNSITNGKVIFQSPHKDSGTYQLSVTYDGDGNLKAASKNITFTIQKVRPILTAPDVVMNYGESKRLEVTLSENDRPISKANVTIEFNGATYTKATDSLGKAYLDLKLNAGTYNALITYGDVTASAKVTVNKLKTQLTANAITTTYNVNKNLVITLKNSQGNPIKGVAISVDLNGVKKYTTDSNGQVKIPAASLVPKTYTAKISFNGNGNYIKSTKEVKVTVKKATPKLTAPAKTYTVKATKKYTVTLKDNNNKVMKNTNVKVKVNGKTYSAKTNSKGVATFTLKLTKKSGYTAIVKYEGSKYYNAKTLRPIITVK